MKEFKIRYSLYYIIAGGFLVIAFLYYFLYNRYLMTYQEQIQLFRYSADYFHGFLSRPGGISSYIGAFFTQFFISPAAGALISTLSIAAIFVLSCYILKRCNIKGILWTLLPSLLMISLQSDYMFGLGYTIALILVLSFISIYISVRKNNLRYISGIAGWILLYLMTGGFSFLAAIVYILYELMFNKSRIRIFIASAFVILPVIIPYLFWQTIYYIPFRDAWLDPSLVLLREATKFNLILFLIYFPLLIISVKILPSGKRAWFSPAWNLKNVIRGTVVILALSWGIRNWVYDPHIRLFLEMDYNVQRGKWERVLELSSKSGMSNRLILYYTNLALYKTGHLEDQMFRYPQTGVNGLWLDREGNELSLFLGSRLFYELGNINEATRWAFDAMVASGQTPPRLLKQLILTSLINEDYKVAEKYLIVLNQSLFYKDWAVHYKNYLSHPDQLAKDPEIAEKRHFLLRDDFVERVNDSDIGLNKLLNDHPDNRMVFEYYMASLLLNKNLNEFAANIYRVRNFGYKELPLYYEEALLMYMGYVKKNVLPSGYGIRRTTVQNFQNYGKAYTLGSKSGNPVETQFIASLQKSFGNTYWFYLHFINNRTTTNEKSHPFN